MTTPDTTTPDAHSPNAMPIERPRRHGAPPVRIALRRERDEVVLDVIDSGPGIPTAERERVFTPFHRLSDDSPGTGLGLALVRQIARLHGGDAVVAENPPSCFRVTLPAKSC